MLPTNRDEIKITKEIKAKAEGDINLISLNRSKRETFPLGTPIFVETAVFVDKDLFEHMKTNFPVDTERELIRFVLAMINAVQLLYHDPSLGRPVNFVLKRLDILKEETAGLVRPPDIDRFLSNFCNWQRTKNPLGDREPQHWDHALILTGLDLYVRGKHGKISNQVVGLAPVAGMCTTTSSCTVNEGRHFESVYVVAHEIGHNLGMRHDGPLADNDCDPASYIMSPTLGSGKITWSACSRRYLQKFLDTPQSRCLLDHGSSAGQLDHSAEGALPGERFDSNQQCCLFGEEGRLRSGSTGIKISTRICNNPRSHSGNHCDGINKRYQACNAQQCLNVPRLTIREFAEQICTRARDVDKDLNGLGMQKISADPEEACLVWCQKRNGGTKSRGWTFPDGTVCQTRRNRYGKSSYCINGRCEDFVCDSYEEVAFSQMPELCPIDRSDNEVIWRTGLRSRHIIKWKSASGCHFNCISPGTGIRLVMSKSKHAKSSIQLCQPDQFGCGRIKSPFQHASMICSKYKERVGRLSGVGMQIPPACPDEIVPNKSTSTTLRNPSLAHKHDSAGSLLLKTNQLNRVYMTVLQQRDMLHTFPTILRKLCCSIFRKSSCQTLNHSRYFRDPTTGIYTNSFEGYWSRLKGMIRRLGVTQSPFLPEYFDMFLWWQHYGPTAADRFRNVLLHISEKYTFCIHLLFFYPLGSRGEVRMRS
ncbi:hypothetical protein GEV33_009359 [Tenebrio molitor]|uniref:Peptidase M12B domain-containing protein n=1 Tax=Tenebrio molitor TaxID=7067 RepID=A0A8J6HFH4_TENMO|nr:hypothetical protein GEV33_009359 [Tenebrio molitor]